MRTPNGENPLVHDARTDSSPAMSGSTPTISTTAAIAELTWKRFVNHLINWEFVSDQYEKELGK